MVCKFELAVNAHIVEVAVKVEAAAVGSSCGVGPVKVVTDRTAVGACGLDLEFYGVLGIGIDLESANIASQVCAALFRTLGESYHLTVVGNSLGGILGVSYSSESENALFGSKVDVIQLFSEICSVIGNKELVGSIITNGLSSGSCALIDLNVLDIEVYILVIEVECNAEVVCLVKHGGVNGRLIVKNIIEVNGIEVTVDLNTHLAVGIAYTCCIGNIGVHGTVGNKLAGHFCTGSGRQRKARALSLGASVQTVKIGI